MVGGGCDSAFLVLDKIRKDYADFPGALQDVSLEVRKGETLVIIGPSGSGKSTLLRCISGLESVDGGSITLQGVRVTDSPALRESMRREIGMVFQAYNLFPHLSVMDNITLAPVKVKKLPLSLARQKGLQYLEMVGLPDKADSYPAQLSGGQQQRVAIARTLAMEPMLLLFDEVTSALDPEMIGEVLAVMKELAGRGSTMLVVTHEMAFAREAGNSIVFMENGRIIEKSDTASFFSGPLSERTAAFLNALKPL